MENSLFKEKTVLITGGTGSIGSEILNALIGLGCNKIIIFSRDEYKQHKLRYKYEKYKNIEYVLGDVRDLEALSVVCDGVDIIFHCAALKHVPISEEMPEEFIKTNIIGALNIKKVALNNKIPIVISISTDKAANPSNVMGLTKAIQEKIFSSSSLSTLNSTKFVNVRFGNVIGTAGSFFPIIYHQIKNKLPITITDQEMTRFFMSKKEAIELILWAAKNGTNGSTVIRKMKATRIKDIVDGFMNVMKVKNYAVKTVGVRVGEKKHEILISEDEMLRIKVINDYFVITPYRKVEISDNLIKGEMSLDESQIKKFVSSTEANRMSKKEVENYIKEYIKGQIKNQFI